MSSTVESLLDKYGAPDGPVVVTLPEGEELRFRAITSYSDLNEFLKLAKSWCEGVRIACAPEMKVLLPNDDATLHAAFTISELSIEPKFSQLDALKLCQAGWLVAEIMAQLDAKRMKVRIDAQTAAVVEDEKKGSLPTPGTGSGSSAPATTSPAAP